MRAQLSMEFVTWVITGLAIFAILWYGNESLRTKLMEGRALVEVRNLCDEIAFEINSAVKAGHGYGRSFRVPEDLFGVSNFSILVRDYTTIIRWDGTSTSCKLLVEGVVGSVRKGWNVVRNLNGTIYVE
jgi:hypothetical protein